MNRRSLREWMPLAVFVIVGASSLVVLQANHQRMLATLHGTVAAVDNLSHARLAIMEAYLSAEQVEAGDPTFAPTQVVPELSRAADLVDDFQAGRTSLLVAPRGLPIRNDSLIAASQHYRQAIEGLRSRLRSGAPLEPAERRSAYAAVDDAGSRLEYQVYDALSDELRREAGRHRIWMLGWASFLFVTAVGLMTLRRENRRADEAREGAERGLARSEAHFRSLIEHAPDLIFLLGADGILRYESPSVEQTLGYQPGELLGRDFFTAVHPEDRQAAKQAFKAALQSSRGSRSERYRFQTKSGDWRWLESTATNLLDDPALEAIVVNSHDATDRIQALEELRESETRNLTLLRAVPDLIFRHTRTGEYLDFQAPEGTRDLYVSPETIRGRNVRDILSPQIADRVLSHTERALDSGDIQRFEYTLPLPGGVQNFEARLLPSGPDEVLTLVRNVTEQKRSEEREKALLEEKASRAEAEAINRAKNEFLSRMSHELRTPLNAILGFGQVLQMDVERENDRESVEQILKAGQHLLSLINEVLDIARIEAGQMSLSVEPVSVRSVVQDSVDLVRITAAKQGIVINAQNALASKHFVGADQQRLKQVLLNLLSNAVKYNRREGTVTLTCVLAGEDRLRIAVQDTGYGISDEKLERLFTPFDRLGADQTSVEGTGLGLALSKGLVAAMGGEIGVESVEGEGSRFWVELPLAPPQEMPEPSPKPRPDVEGPRDAAAVTHTVLFIEDNLANVRLIERLFQRRPRLRLLTAIQGRLGLELAREHCPDLILLDLNLPDLSGDEVLLQLRRESRLRHIPVVMVSGDAVPAQAKRMLELGAQAYITKPFQLKEILDLIDEHLPQ